MLVLEDGEKLRLLDGILAADLRARQPFALTDTPTRFGRISLTLEPAAGRAWKAHFVRKDGIVPESVEIRMNLAPQLTLGRVDGAGFHSGANGVAIIDPAAREWTAVWGA